MKQLLITLIFILSILSANIDEAKKAYHTKDFKKALPMFEQLSKDGNAESNYYLGTMYGFPYGVNQDYAKAFAYYTIASSKPNKRRLKSIFNLALMYKEGWGVKQNYKKAFSLFKTLDDKGIGVAQFMMGHMYSDGNGVEQNIHKAIKYFEKGCKNKYSEACYFAGYFYENGIDIGLEEAYKIAKGFHEKGCELDFKKSCDALRNMKESLSFYQKYMNFFRTREYFILMSILLVAGWWRIWKHKKEKKGIGKI